MSGRAGLGVAATGSPSSTTGAVAVPKPGGMMGCGPAPRRAGAVTGADASAGNVRVVVRPSGAVVVTVPGTMVLPSGIVPSTASSAHAGTKEADSATTSADRTINDAPVRRPVSARELIIGEHFFNRLHRRGTRLPEIDEPAADGGQQEKDDHEETHEAVHGTFDLFVPRNWRLNGVRTTI